MKELAIVSHDVTWHVLSLPQVEFAAPVGYKDEIDFGREKTAAEDEEVRICQSDEAESRLYNDSNIIKLLQTLMELWYFIP